MTPSDVSRRYSNGLCRAAVFRKGYKYSGMCAARNLARVSPCDATHCSSASALHTRFDTAPVSAAGDRYGYIATISCGDERAGTRSAGGADAAPLPARARARALQRRTCSSAVIVPYECQSSGARSA